MFEDILELEIKTKSGLDKLELMVRFISIIETKKSKVDNESNRTKSWLVQQLKRGLTPSEEVNLMQGILNYIQSDGETNERIEAMKYLFEAEFLNY